MVRLLTFSILLLALAACNRTPTRLPFDDVYFRASAKALDRSAREDFEVIVRQASQSDTGARQAAEYEAVRYCIEWFGRSDHVWQQDPADETVRIQNDALIVRGRCTG